MSRFTASILFGFFLVYGLSLQSFAATGSNFLDLKRAVRQSLVNNLDIKIDRLKVVAKEGQWQQEKGAFDINWNFSYSSDTSKTPSSTSLDEVGSSALETDTISYSNSFTKLFTWGTSLNLPYSYAVTESNAGTRVFDQNHQPTLSLKLTQPILRTFDFDYHVSSLLQAELKWQAELNQQKDKAEQTIYDTIKLYTKALEAHELMAIRQRAYEIAGQTLDMIEKKIRIGRASEIDKLDALAKKLQSGEQLASAQTQAKDQKQKLSLMTFALVNQDFQLSLKKEALPEYKILDLAALTEVAKRQRGERQKDKLLLKQAQLAFDKSKTDRLPKIDLAYEISYQGLDGVSSSAHKQISDQIFESTTLSLNMQYPLLGYAARASHRTKEVTLNQQRLKNIKNIQNLELDISNRLNKLNNSHLSLKAFNTVQAAETQKFDRQSQKHKLGKLSTFELLAALKDKEQAELDHLKAKMNYLRNHYDLARVTGQLRTKF